MRAHLHESCYHLAICREWYTTAKKSSAPALTDRYVASLSVICCERMIHSRNKPKANLYLLDRDLNCLRPVVVQNR